MNPRRKDETPLVIDIYARISRANDGTTRQVEGQVEDCLEELEERGAKVGHIHRDNSKSAWNPKVKRPEFEALMKRLESGEADGVIVYDLTRFSRKPIEGERLIDLADQNIVVWSLTGEYDLMKADGRRQFRNDMTTAANESDKISERVRRGKRRKALRGRSNASRRGFARFGYLPVPEGWEPGDPRQEVPPEVLQAEQTAVREVVRQIFAGGSLAAAARYLNDHGFRTTTGLPWRSDSLGLLLKAPSLAGIIVYKGDRVGMMEGEYPLDVETWERLQALLASRSPGRPVSEDHVLTGILWCGTCGSKMRGRIVPNRPPYPDGVTPWVYRCVRDEKNPENCGHCNIDGRFAEGIVEEATLLTLENPQHAERIARAQERTAAARLEIETEIEWLTKQSEALASKVVERGVDWVLAASEPLDRRLAELKADLERLEPDTSTGAYAEPGMSRQSWEEASMAGRRVMMRRAFPNGIVVRPVAKHTEAERRNPDRLDFSGRRLR